MKPVLITVQEDGKVVITVDEIKHILDEAYNAGLADGMAMAKPVPSYISTTPYYETHPIEVTCRTIAEQSNSCSENL